MRYIVNAQNYVVAVSFGSEVVYNDCACTEYTGKVPSGYSTLEDWHESEGDKLWRWKIVSGNLTLDSTATAPEEGRWGVPKLQSKGTFMPGKSGFTVKPDTGYDGLSSVSVSGDTNLDEKNIVRGATIFSITGEAHIGFRLDATAGVHSNTITFDLENCNGRLPYYITLFQWEDYEEHGGEAVCAAIVALDLQGKSGIFKNTSGRIYHKGVFDVCWSDTSNMNRITIEAPDGENFTGRYVGVAMY